MTQTPDGPPKLSSIGLELPIKIQFKYSAMEAVSRKHFGITLFTLLMTTVVGYGANQEIALQLINIKDFAVEVEISENVKAGKEIAIDKVTVKAESSSKAKASSDIIRKANVKFRWRKTKESQWSNWVARAIYQKNKRWELDLF